MSQIINDLTYSSENIFNKANDPLHRLQVKKDEESSYIQSNTKEALNLARKVSIEIMAKEWLTQLNVKSETIAYLIENFLPVLVLGCEKVLNEADNRNLIKENKSDLNFNPINNLAQFLMRNNPKYNNHNELSPYVRSMRQVYHEIKEYILMKSAKTNQLAQIKTEIRNRREDREHQEALRKAEKNRRESIISNLFDNWLLSNRSRLELSLVDISIKMFMSEILIRKTLKDLATLNLDKMPSFCFSNDKLILDKRLMKHEFDQCILGISEDLKSEYFDYFIEFMKNSGKFFIDLANKNVLNRILQNLFDLLDLTKTGLITRKRIYDVLDKYYISNVTQSSEYRYPLKWPVIDPSIKFEQDLRSSKKTIQSGINESVKSIILNNDNVEENINTVDNLNLNTEVENGQKIQEPNTSNATATTSDVKPLEKDSSSDVDKLNASLEMDSANKLSAIEHKNDDKTIEDNFDSIPNHNSLKNIEIEVEEEETSPMKHNEILFIKGGIMYYKPYAKPIDALDRQMIRPQMVNDSSLLNFNEEYINSIQFINLMNNFMAKKTYNSEKNINELINSIKDNFTESESERDNKIKHVESLKAKFVNDEKIAKIFDKLDNEGSRSLDLNFICDLLEKFKDGMYKDVVKTKSHEFKEEILSKLKNKDIEICMNKTEFIELLTRVIHELNSPIFTEQLLTFLNNAVHFDYPQRIRGENRKMWLNELENIGKTSSGGFDELYKQLFVSLLKDAELHSDNRHISAYVGLLEKINSHEIGLKYHATTSYDSKFMLEKCISRKEAQVSFEAIDTRNIIQITKVRQNPKIYYFDKNCSKDGSLLIIPLKFNRNQVYGILGIDTIQETSNKFFSDTDLKFYEGVASTFAKSYTSIVFRNRLVKACLSSFEWLSNRCPFIDDFNIYFVNNSPDELKIQPNTNAKFVLQKVYNHSTKQTVSNNDTYIKDHIYECAFTSETTIGYFNDETSYCYALRNEDRHSVFVIEIICNHNNGEVENDLSEIENVLYVLHKCQESLLSENVSGEIKNLFYFEDAHSFDKHEILFEKEFYKFTFDKLDNLQGTSLAKFEPNVVSPTFINEILDLIVFVNKYEEFVTHKTIDQTFLTKLKLVDPTQDGFLLNNKELMDLSNKSVINELNQAKGKLKTLKEDTQVQVIEGLIDYVCLIQQLKEKSSKF